MGGSGEEKPYSCFSTSAPFSIPGIFTTFPTPSPFNFTSQPAPSADSISVASSSQFARDTTTPDSISLSSSSQFARDTGIRNNKLAPSLFSFLTTSSSSSSSSSPCSFNISSTTAAPSVFSSTPLSSFSIISKPTSSSPLASTLPALFTSTDSMSVASSQFARDTTTPDSISLSSSSQFARDTSIRNNKLGPSLFSFSTTSSSSSSSSAPCIFNISSTTAAPSVIPSTPLSSFSIISKPTSSSPLASTSPALFTSTSRCSPMSNTNPCSNNVHVCQVRGNKSIWGQQIGNNKSFSRQQWGSRVTAYTPTLEDSNHVEAFDISTPAFTSISKMPIYEHKSHEELRWEDYQSQSGKTQISWVGDQPLLALPVLMLPVMPVNTGFIQFMPF